MVDDNVIGNGKGWLLYLAGADTDVSLMHVREAGVRVRVGH